MCNLMLYEFIVSLWGLTFILVLDEEEAKGSQVYAA